MEAAREDQVPLESFATGAIVRQAAPRLLRDGFGPLALFFAGWKLIGLASGIGIATLFATAVFAHERRQGRPAMIVRVALAFVAFLVCFCVIAVVRRSRTQGSHGDPVAGRRDCRRSIPRRTRRWRAC